MGLGVEHSVYRKTRLLRFQAELRQQRENLIASRYTELPEREVHWLLDALQQLRADFPDLAASISCLDDELAASRRLYSRAKLLRDVTTVLSRIHVELGSGG